MALAINHTVFDCDRHALNTFCASIIKTADKAGLDLTFYGLRQRRPPNDVEHLVAMPCSLSVAPDINLGVAPLVARRNVVILAMEKGATILVNEHGIESVYSIPLTPTSLRAFKDGNTFPEVGPYAPNRIKRETLIEDLKPLDKIPSEVKMVFWFRKNLTLGYT